MSDFTLVDYGDVAIVGGFYSITTTITFYADGVGFEAFSNKVSYNRYFNGNGVIIARGYNNIKNLYISALYSSTKSI